MRLDASGSIEEVECVLKIIINTVIKNDRRERFLGFVGSRKGMRKWVDSVDHFERYLDLESARSMGKNEVGAMLRAMSLLTGFAFSSQRDYQEGRFGSVGVFLDDLLDSGNGALLWIEGLKPLCVYLGEDLSSKYVWEADLRR